MNSGMMILCLGIALWIGIHLVPSVGVGLRTKLVAAIGLVPYRGLFSLCVIGALVLIVLGWRATPPEPVYVPPAWGRHATMTLMVIVMLLFFAARLPCNVKRVLRHPLLLAILLWSIAHLLSNGESRSLVLFLGMGGWALLEVVTINRRLGEWVRPAPVPAVRDVLMVVVALVAYGLLLYLHRYFTGIALIGV